MKNLNDKAIEATKRYLTMRGCEVVKTDKDNLVQIIAKDEDVLVFVTVVVNTEEISDEKPSRKEVEKAAIRYFAEAAKNTENCTVRFDVVSMTIIGEDRALIRHHINAYGTK